MGVADVEQGMRAPDHGSAKAALTTSVSADTSGKAAPAPGAPLENGQTEACERPVNTPRSYEEDSWFNIQWKLFLFGLVLFVPSCIGVVLPLCSRPRFPTRGHKSGWTANIILSTLYTALIVTLCVLLTRPGATSSHASSTSYSPPTSDASSTYYPPPTSDASSAYYSPPTNDDIMYSPPPPPPPYYSPPPPPPYYSPPSPTGASRRQGQSALGSYPRRAQPSTGAFNRPAQPAPMQARPSITTPSTSSASSSSASRPSPSSPVSSRGRHF